MKTFLLAIIIVTCCAGASIIVDKLQGLAVGDEAPSWMQTARSLGEITLVCAASGVVGVTLAICVTLVSSCR